MIKTTQKVNKERWDRSVEALNESLSKLYLAPSSIHGIGVFTREDIKQGEKIYASDMPAIFDLPYSYIKKLKKYLQKDILGMFPYMLYTTSKDRKNFMYPPCPFVMFMNHNDEPNYNHKEDVALVDIPAGTELTEDYRVVEDYQKIYTFLKV